MNPITIDPHQASRDELLGVIATLTAAVAELDATKVSIVTNPAGKPVLIQPGNITAKGGDTLTLPPIEHTIVRLKIHEDYVPAVPGGVKITPVRGKTTEARVLTVPKPVQSKPVEPPPVVEKPTTPAPLPGQAPAKDPAPGTGSTPPTPINVTIGILGKLKKTVTLTADAKFPIVPRTGELYDGGGRDFTVTAERAFNIHVNHVRAGIRGMNIPGKSNYLIEAVGEEIDLYLEGIRSAGTKKYAIWAEARQAKDWTKGIHDRAAIRMEIVRCAFASSDTETPGRLMQGSYARILESDFFDTLDIDGQGNVSKNKANQGFRGHGWGIDAWKTRFGLWTKLGPPDSGNITPHDVCKFARFDQCQFPGGITVSRGLQELTIVAPKDKPTVLDGIAGLSDYALSITESALPSVHTMHPKLYFENVVLIGEWGGVDMEESQFVHCLRNGKQLHTRGSKF